MLTQLRRLGPEQQTLVKDKLVLWDLWFSLRILSLTVPFCPARCSRCRILMTSRIASGLSMTPCPMRTISSDCAPERWLLQYGTTPSDPRSFGPGCSWPSRCDGKPAGEIGVGDEGPPKCDGICLPARKDLRRRLLGKAVICDGNTLEQLTQAWPRPNAGRAVVFQVPPQCARRYTASPTKFVPP